MSALDVAVIGGGPAGLATALACRRRGLAVRVLEPHAPPLDKACGEGIMPAGVERLRAWGVEPAGVRLRGIRFLEGELDACGDFPSGPGLGVRRLELHRALLAAAERAGAELAWGWRATGIDPARGRVDTTRGAVEARYVVAADGLRSPARGWLGLAASPARRRRCGVRRHFALAPWSDRVEVHWSDGAEAYVTPVGEREVGVALLWSGAGGGFDRLLPRFPALARRLAGVAVASRDRGSGPFEQRVRGAVRGQAALVGDAGGYVDAITGEGLALAFAEAALVAEAIAAGDLRRFARSRVALRRVPEALTRALLLVERRPHLRRRLLRALARPELFAALLGHLTGADGPPLAWTAARLALRLAVP